MGAVTKRFFIGLVIFAMAAMVFLGALQQKAEASVSWGQETTEVAKHYKGVKYKWGGKTPKQGFDASGFTQFIYDYSAADLKLQRTTQEQYKIGKAVSKKDLKEGDLVFFNPILGVKILENQIHRSKTCIKPIRSGGQSPTPLKYHYIKPMGD